MADQNTPDPIVSVRPGLLARALNSVEWLGNKLPDPAFLFLIGLLVVLAISHFAAPRLPEGFEVRWVPDPTRVGGVDQQRGVIGRVGVDAAGREVFEPARVVVEETPGAAPVARLAIDATDEWVLGADGRPVDLGAHGWSVFEKTPQDTDGDPRTPPVLVPNGNVMVAQSLVTSNGWYWLLSSMVKNFLGFAPLGVVLLGMLGIGPMEKVGLISALLRSALARVPGQLLTPSMVFLGIMSSLGSDAGYVVLPPLAAMAYLAVGRSPLAGIAAVFAGVAAGFNANLLITSLEPMMSNMSQGAAQTVDAERAVAATASWYFMAVSTVVLTFVGWGVTAVFVEKRLSRKSAADGGPDSHAKSTMDGHANLSPDERKGLVWAGVVFALGLAATVLLVFWKGSPLHGSDGPFPRWVAVIVPLMFMLTIAPAMAFGVAVGNIRSTKDATQTMIDSMASMAPIVVLAFFAGQFVAAFEESGLGRMLAFSGGEWLFNQQFGAPSLLVAFIFVTMFFNLFVGSMSAKYALFAPIFVPMFMLIGIRPEMTQTAYRIGDSTSNVITPLNPYMIIILMYVQKYAPKAGIGTLIAMMLPYSIVFTLVWIVMIVGWSVLGMPLGPGDPNTVFSDGYGAVVAP